VLHQPDMHEALTEERWVEERVRARIRRIVTATDEGLRGPRLLWRAHEWDGWHGTSPMKNLYVGAAGVLWALDELRRHDHAETGLDLADLAVRTLELFGARPDFMKHMKLPSPANAALLTGESGILLVAWRLAPSGRLADDLLAHVRANVVNEADEVMWGTPGTLIAARAMLDWTGDPRWRDAWNESADALLARRDSDGFWVQRLYGREMRGLGPAHGLVGNVQALLPLLDAEGREALTRDANRLLERTAFVENGTANWPYRERAELPSPDGSIRLQWCAGAPGIVVAAGDYLHEELLVAGAELTWRAGPPALEKGSGICHGTAGNGFAFLKAWDRTGDEVWLHRARAFAMHALAQVDRLPPRYSLFTGGIGAALFAARCLEERAAYPAVDSWE
jgi:Lanthionine synthetase C-like protein